MTPKPGRGRPPEPTGKGRKATKGTPAVTAAALQTLPMRLMAAATDLALGLDATNRIVHVQARDAALHALLSAQWLNRPLAETVATDSQAKLDLLLSGPSAQAAPTPRHLNHLLPGGATLPVRYTALHLHEEACAAPELRCLLVGQDLRESMALQQRVIEAQQAMERDHWRYREAETRFRSLFLTAPEAVVVTESASLRIQEANPAALALLETGRSRRTKAVGTPLPSLLDAGSAPAVAAAAEQARSMGRQERARATLADGGNPVWLSFTPFQQDGAAQLMVRLTTETAAAPALGTPELAASRQGSAEAAWAEAFVRGASDALVFTDASGVVRHANAAFARLAQLPGVAQARGEPLDRWLGRSGVELSVLMAHLRDGGNPGLLSTDVRGDLGLVTEVEIAASSLRLDNQICFAFDLRDTQRRLAPSEDASPRVPASVEQLSELVGRVPLKQIVAETSDLIEKLSIESALRMTRDNRAMAAQMLGLSRQSLYVKLHRYGLGGMGAVGTEAPEEP